MLTPRLSALRRHIALLFLLTLLGLSPAPQALAAIGSVTTVNSTPNPSNNGDVLTLSATVTSALGLGAAPTGTVTFFVDGTQATGPVIIVPPNLNPAPLTAVAPSATSGTATATFQADSPLPGSHLITAQYSGDGTYNPSTSGQFTQIVKAIPAVAVATSGTPSLFGQNVTFTATLSGGFGTPTGTVQFSADGSPLGPPTTVTGAGVAQITTNILPVPGSPHAITADYSGDSFNTAASGALAGGQTVNKANTTTSTPTAAPAATTLGQSVTFTATVTDSSAGSAGVPTGSVTFTDGAGFTQAATVGSDGRASVTTSALSVATHNVTAQYTSGDADFNPSAPSGPLAFTVGAEPTTTSVTSSINPSGFGQAVVFTVTVAGANGITPNAGTVNLSSGGPTLGSAPLNANGQAQITLANLPVGPNTVTATYVGTPDFTTSSGSVAQTVNATTNPILLTSAPNPSTFNANVTLTVTVQTSGGVNPTGTVTFFSDGVMLGSNTLSGGSTTFNVSTLTVGTHSITASYGGDGNYNPGTSGQLTQIVNQGATTTALSPAPSPNPSTFGSPVMFSALVTATGGGAAPTGTVQFIDTSNGNVVIGAISASPSGTTATASFSTSSLSVGTHAIRAIYSGDGTLAGSASSTTNQTVTPSATTPVQLTGDPTTTTYGNPVSFTATVNTPTPLPAGSTLLFKDNGVPIAGTVANPNPAPVSGSSKAATVTAPLLTGGAHTITADFTSGDTTVLSGGTTSLTYNVSPAAPTITVTSSNATSVFQQPVIFTAAINGVTGGVGPTGSVQFLSDGAAIGNPVPLASAGPGKSSASLQFKDLDGGAHNITAAYAGDGNYTDKVSSPFTQTVQPAATATSLSSSANPSTFNQIVNFHAAVSSTTPGVPTPTGSISFLDGSATLATISLANGQADFPIQTLSPGTHTITALYNPSSGNFAVSSLPINQVVQPAASNVSATVTPNPSVFGQPVTFTATVVSNGGVAATGTISFAFNGAVFGTATLGASGRDDQNRLTSTATFSTSVLPAGADQVVVTYSGDAANTGGSMVLTQNVFKADSATEITSSANPSTFGQPVTFMASVVDSTAGSTGKPTGSVTFLDGGQPIPSADPANPNPAPLVLNTDGTVTAAFTTTGLSVATDAPHVITVVYNPDTNFNSSTGLLRGGQTVFDVPAGITGLNPAFLLVPGTARDGNHAPLGPSDSQLLTITGTSFRSDAFVLFNGDKLAPTAVAPDGSALQVLVPPGDVSVSGFAQVQVVNRRQAQTGADPNATRAIPVNPLKALPNFAVPNRPDKFLRMFSIPFDYSAFSPYDVLAGVTLNPPLNGDVYNPDVNILGANPTVLSGATTPLYHWDPASLLYQTTLPNADPTKGLKPADLHLTLGQGFWIVGGPETQTLGIMRLGTPAAFNPIGVPLLGGWNMIGDPFPRDIPLGSLRVLTQSGVTLTFADAVGYGLVSPVLWRWDGTQYVACFDGAAGVNGALQQYEGYWLYSYQPVTLLVTFPQ